jgi:siroheme synthase-like protein
VIVIGGGNVACEKVAGLRKAGARITIVSPTLAPELQELKDAGELEHVARPWQPSDLDQDWAVVMVATDDGAVNRQVSEESRARRVWCNAADDPANCDFILPSVVRQGQVVVAASTGGGSPALARRLREELTAFLAEDYAPLSDLLADVRGDIRRRGLSVDAETWQRAIDARLRALVAQRRLDEARQHLLEGLGAGEQVAPEV